MWNGPIAQACSVLPSAAVRHSLRRPGCCPWIPFFLGRNEHIDDAALQAAAADRPDVVVADGVLLDEEASPSLVSRIPSIAPVLEVVDAACPQCPHWPAGRPPVRSGLQSPRHRPCPLLMQPNREICWNIVRATRNVQTLLKAINVTALRERYADPMALRDPKPVAVLTPREIQVVRLVAAGKTNQEIAVALFESENTIEHHMSSILRKLGLHSRNQIGRGGA